jgi:hypothetical protein
LELKVAIVPIESLDNELETKNEKKKRGKKKRRKN